MVTSSFIFEFLRYIYRRACDVSRSAFIETNKVKYQLELRAHCYKRNAFELFG